MGVVLRLHARLAAGWPAAKREAVAHVRSVFELSERRACRIIGCVRMTARYSARKPIDTKLRERLRALAQKRRRFGYRRLHVLLRREGFKVNHKRLFRLYREERLTVRRRDGRKRAVEADKPKRVSGLSDEQIALMEREFVNLEREFKIAEKSYRTDHLDLVLTNGYLGKLLGNARVVRYLAQHHNDILAEFQKLAEMEVAAA